MIKFLSNTLLLEDGTMYNLDTTSKERVIQGLKFQVQEKSLTNKEFHQCLALIGGGNIKETDNFSVIHDMNKNSETFNKYIVTVISENYDLMKELYQERQKEGEYSYTIII